jgi:hypothetical protein
MQFCSECNDIIYYLMQQMFDLDSGDKLNVMIN